MLCSMRVDLNCHASFKAPLQPKKIHGWLK
jgi:hypothetical protein